MNFHPLLLLFYLFVASISYAQGSLIYSADFEAADFVADTPLGNGWRTTSDSIVITNEEFHLGSQSVRIPFNTPENIVSLGFSLPSQSILFVDYYMQFFASELPVLPLLTEPETTFFLTVQSYDSGQGRWVFLDGDSDGGGTWFSAGDTFVLDPSNRTGWHRITLRFNLILNSWDLYIDGKLLAVDLGFVDALSPDSPVINIYGSSSGTAYLDTFSIMTSNPLFKDADLDGMDDAFEALYGLNSSIDDRNQDPDNDGFTNVEEYQYGIDPKTPNTIDVTLSANGNLTVIDEANGNLQIIQDNNLLLDVPLGEAFNLNIIGEENSGDINVLLDGTLIGMLNIEGDVGTVRFGSSLSILSGLNISGASNVLFNGAVSVEGTTSIEVSEDLILDLNGSLVVVNGNLNGIVGGDFTVRGTSNISVNTGNSSFHVVGAIWLDDGSSFTIDNRSAAFGNVQLQSGQTITVSNNSLIDISNNSMVLIAIDSISLQDNSAVIAKNSYLIIQTREDFAVVDSTMSLDGSTLFSQVEGSLSVIRSVIDLKDGIAQLSVFFDATIAENSKFTLENGDLYAQINGNLTISNNSEVVVTKEGNIGMNVIGDALIEQNSRLEVNNNPTASRKSLQLIVSGLTKFDSGSVLALKNTELNIFSFGNIDWSSSALEVSTGNVFIRARNDLTFTNSTSSITGGTLSVNVAQSMHFTNGDTTVTDGNFYLNTRVDLIMDTDSALSVTGGDFYANIFGEATLGGSIYMESLFAMFVRGNFTLGEIGSLDALITYLNSNQSITINGRMGTNKAKSEVHLLAQNFINMASSSPITSHLLAAISNMGIFLYTEVDLLTVQTVGGDLNNTFALGDYTGSAEIEVHEVDDLILDQASNRDGPIRVIAGGTITANNVVSSKDAPGHNIGLMSLRGDLEIGFVGVGTTHGQISLSAGGEIRELSSSDENADLIGNRAVIYAGTSIDAALEMEIDEIYEFANTDVIFDTIGDDDVELFLSTGNHDIHVQSMQGNIVATHVDNRSDKINLESPNRSIYVGYSDSSIIESESIFITMSENGVPSDFELVLSATDLDNSDVLNWSIGVNGNNGFASVRETSADNTATIDYLPNLNFNGNDSFVVQVTYVSGNTKNITVNVTVDEDYPQISYLDTDSDGILDKIEDLYDALDSNLATDILEDYDNDGIPNIFEVYNNSNPDDPESIPSFEDSSGAYLRVNGLLDEALGNTFPTIAEAVAAAQNYNYTIIEVLPGGDEDYVENVTLSSPTLLIASQGSATTTLRSINPLEEALTIENLCVLDGFTIRYDDGPAVDIDSPEQVIIRNCSIASDGVNLVSTFGGGISKSGGIIRLINCYMPEAYVEAILDTTAPVITLIGESEITIEQGGNFTDPGATAADNVDGNITANIVVGGTVDTTAPGIYTLTYNVSDAAGNAAAQVMRVVTVANAIEPVITLIGESEITIEQGGNFTDPGATAADNVDGNITANIVVDGTVDTTAPGIYTLTYNVSDAAGNAAVEVTRTINVIANVNVYTVIFQLVDGIISLVSGDPVQEIIEGESAIAPEVEAAPGYVFTGWDTAFDNVTGNLIITAQYDQKDTDGDGMLDIEEFANGLDVLVNDAMADLDGDGYPNIYELRRGGPGYVNDSGLVPSATHVVNPISSYNTIQEAIDAVNANYSIIRVEPSASPYTGSGNPNFVIDSDKPSILLIANTSDSATFLGDDMEAVLDGEGALTGPALRNDESAIVGFTIRNCLANASVNNSSLHLNGGDNNLVSRCKIHDSLNSSNAAVYVDGASNLLIEYVSIFNNPSPGLDVSSTYNLNLNNVTMYGNSGDAANSVAIYFAKDVSLNK